MTAKKPRRTLMEELQAASRAVDRWPKRDRELRELSLRAAAWFADEAATSVKATP